MIQNFSEQKQYFLDESQNHEYQILGSSKIFFKLDSDNKIFQFRYSTSDTELNPYFEFLGTFFQDKKIDDLTLSLAHDVYGLVENKKYKYDPFKLDKALSLSRKALLNLKHDGIASGISTNEIICRCNHIDLEILKKYFKQFKGVRNDIIRNSNVSMTCGSCREDFDKYLVALSRGDIEVGDETAEDFTALIHEALMSFNEYSAQNLIDIEVRAIDVELPKVTLTIKVFNEEFDLEQFKVSLTNYLCSKLGMGIEAELTVL
ncbi:MAG: hypothetical protein ACJAS4_000242 [Bacteriovoracaceae bacterium]|jgi:hypothetical protein